MESFKSIDDYPSTPCTLLSAENLAQYDDYIQQAICMHIAAREWASKNPIWFHTR